MAMTEEITRDELLDFIIEYRKLGRHDLEHFLTELVRWLSEDLQKDRLT